jgi:hypothetical protein
MDELIARITSNVGLDDATARNAVRTILSFLYQEGDREKMVTLAERIPGAEAYIDASEEDSSATLGGLGGMMGGGAMAVLGKLQGLGLGWGRSRASPRRRLVLRVKRRDAMSSMTSLRRFLASASSSESNASGLVHIRHSSVLAARPHLSYQREYEAEAVMASYSIAEMRAIGPFYAGKLKAVGIRSSRKLLGARQHT